MPKPYTTKSKGVVTVFEFKDIDKDWEQWLLLRSDAHHDSVACDREVEYKHLKKALDRDAIIFDFGDTFDAMQGKFDPRRSYDDLLEEYRGIDYYDRVVNGTVKDYAPYAKNFGMFTAGNHKSAVARNANINILDRLVYGLNREHGGSVILGSYGGWIVFRFTAHKTVCQSISVRYHHGSSGAEAPVTRGVIQTARQGAYIDNADIVINGHNHQTYIVPVKIESVSRHNTVKHD